MKTASEQTDQAMWVKHSESLYPRAVSTGNRGTPGARQTGEASDIYSLVVVDQALEYLTGTQTSYLDPILEETFI